VGQFLVQFIPLGGSILSAIQQQRLDTSREYLIKAKSEKTITEIAFICGFNKPSTFAHYYKQRFGELPSQTLTNGLLS